MLIVRRRTLLRGLTCLSAATVGALSVPLWAQTAVKGKLAPKLRIVIPAASRSTLDEAGRALGDALVGLGLSDEIEYENKEGNGGTTGLAWYAGKYGTDPNALFMGDSNLVGAVALQKPVVDLTRLRPVARLTTDYLVVVVAGPQADAHCNRLCRRCGSRVCRSAGQIGG
jgi:putative tricarboxylic transport membrane protein